MLFIFGFYVINIDFFFMECVYYFLSNFLLIKNRGDLFLDLKVREKRNIGRLEVIIFLNFVIVVIFFNRIYFLEGSCFCYLKGSIVVVSLKKYFF